MAEAAAAQQQFELLSRSFMDYKGVLCAPPADPGHLQGADDNTHPTCPPRCCCAVAGAPAVCAQNPGSVNSKCQLASLTEKLQKQGMHG